MFDNELDYSKLADGGDRDDAPRLAGRDPTEYPEEGETPEDYEDWEEGEFPDDGENDEDGEYPRFDEDGKKKWRSERRRVRSPKANENGRVLGVINPPVAVVAMVAALTFFSQNKTGPTVDFEYLTPHGTTMDYGIHVVMEYTPAEDETLIDWNDTDTGLVLVAQNAKESVSVPLISSNDGTEISVTPKETGKGEKEPTYEIDLIFTGTMEGLAEKHPYSVSVAETNGKKTTSFSKQNIKTSEKQTEIRSFSGECSCEKDGNYRFYLDYTDENHYYSDFSYELHSPDGITVAGGGLDTMKGTIIIPKVDKLDGDEYDLILRFHSDDPRDAEKHEELLDNGLRIITDHGSVTVTQEIYF